jgi:hypothetical protein
MLNPAAHVIEKLGGPKAVSKLLNKHESRIRRWTYPRDRGGTGGLIPAAEQVELLRAAIGMGWALKPDDFFFGITGQQASVVGSNQESEASKTVADQDASVGLRPTAGAGPP